MIYSRRIVSFIISLLILVAIAAGFTTAAHAAVLTGGETGTSFYTYLGKSKDGKGWMNPHYRSVKQMKYTVKINGETKVAYCMEPGESFVRGHKYTVNSTSKAKAWKELSSSKQRVLALVMYYGYNNGKKAPYGNSNDYYAATQALVWEAVDGDITLSKTGKWHKKANKHDNLIYNRYYAEKNYNWIKQKISKHVEGADFTSLSYNTAKTYQMRYSYANKNWACTLKDKTGGNYLKRHKTTNENISVSRSGYSYTFKTKKAGTKKAVLVNAVGSGTSQAMLILTSSSAANQSLIFGARDDTAFYVKLSTESKGALKLVKSSDDGKKTGFKFKVTCAGNGYSAVHTTGADGMIVADLYPGEYTVKEQLTEAQKKAGYVQSGVKKVTIKENKTTTLKVHNKKVPEDGHLLIKKENDDGSSPEGFRFQIENKTTGKKTECITDEEGIALLKDLDPGEYIVTEMLTEEQAARFEEPQSRDAVIKSDGKTVSVSFVNETKTTPVILKKMSEDGNVADIEFKISGETIWGESYETRTVKTSQDGTLEIGELVPGTYIFEEVMPEDRGYLQKDPVEITITGDEADPLLIEFTNTLTSLYITKTDSITKDFVDGASFELLDEDGVKLISFDVIQKNGRVSLESGEINSSLWICDDPEEERYGCIRGLIEGKVYVLKETKAPVGYLPTDDVTFVFEEGLKLDVENDRAPAEPAAPEEPVVYEEVPVDKPVPDASVETGDRWDYLMPVALLLLAVGVMCALLFRRENPR